MSHTPKLELIIVREPDGPTDIYPYLDGVALSPADVVEYVIDAAAGHTTEDWIQMRDDAVAAASPAVAVQLAAEFTNPPGADEIDGGWPPPAAP